MPKDHSSSHKHKHRHRHREHGSILERAEREARKKEKRERRHSKSKRDHASRKKSKSVADSSPSGKKDSSQVGKHDMAWNEKFDRLKEYKEEHGDCLVPSLYEKDPKLGTWVRWQRTKQNKMSEDRRLRLESIGFQWHVQQDAWGEMFDRLVKYKDEHGDCIVPQKYKEDPNLGRWVKTQRLRQIDMPLERQQKLEDLGFVWRAPEGKHRISSRKSGIAKKEPPSSSNRNVNHNTTPPTGMDGVNEAEASPDRVLSNVPETSVSIAPVLPSMPNTAPRAPMLAPMPTALPTSTTGYVPVQVPSAATYIYPAIDTNEPNQHLWC
mmetsp:Transcript_19756/g.27950  ORF Transcript_19756/g.27950 Transcript_19756/m.27950 type:complete len:323 (-) Transcript_19756:200-1168(-)